MAAAIQLREGLVARLRETRNLRSEEAVARLIGTDRTTLRRIMNGSQPSGAFIAGFCDAFGLGLGEAFEIVQTSPASAKAA